MLIIKLITLKEFFFSLFFLAGINVSLSQCFEGDCQNGYGELEESKTTYKGEFLNGKKHGYGELTSIDSPSFYKGDFFNDEIHGKGEFFFGGLEQYSGDFEDGIIDGNGKYVFKDGSYYEGGFLKGKLTGTGTFVFVNNGEPTGEKYVGEVLNSNMHGKGVYNHSSGNIYDGDFLENKFNGKGKLTYDKGNLTQIEYIGEFDENKVNGQGVFTWIGNTRFEGLFENETPVEGKFFWQGELFYEGKLSYYYSEIIENDLSFSTGQFTVLTYNWSNVGYICFPNGDFYVGEVEIDRRGLFSPSGEGVMVYPDGSYLEGSFDLSNEPNMIFKLKLIKTSNGNLNLAYGIALVKYKLWAEAEREFRKALNIDPTNEKFRKALEESIQQLENNSY